MAVAASWSRATAATRSRKSTPTCSAAARRSSEASGSRITLLGRTTVPSSRLDAILTAGRVIKHASGRFDRLAAGNVDLGDPDRVSHVSNLPVVSMLVDRLSAAGGSLADQAPLVLELSLPPSPSSAAQARRALSVYCREHAVPDELAEVGRLVLSELVTNAVLHARTPLLMWAEYAAGQLTVAVEDGEADLPRLIPLDDGQRDGGRGVAIVDQLGATWGLVRTSLGKIVWVALTDPAATTALPAPRAEDPTS